MIFFKPVVIAAVQESNHFDWDGEELVTPFKTVSPPLLTGVNEFPNVCCGEFLLTELFSVLELL